MLPSKGRHFQGHPCLFQQDNAKPHSACITTVWHIMKCKPRTFVHLSDIKQEWKRIPPTKLQQLVSSVPKCLLIVVQRKGYITQW